MPLIIYTSNSPSWAFIYSYISSKINNGDYVSSYVQVGTTELVSTSSSTRFVREYDFSRTLSAIARVSMLDATKTSRSYNPTIASERPNKNTDSWFVNGNPVDVTGTKIDALQLISTFDSLYPHYLIEYNLSIQNPHSWTTAMLVINPNAESIYLIQTSVTANFNNNQATTVSVSVIEYKFKKSKFPSIDVLIPKPKDSDPEDKDGNDLFVQAFIKLKV